MSHYECILHLINCKGKVLIEVISLTLYSQSHAFLSYKLCCNRVSDQTIQLSDGGGHELFVF